MTSPQGLSISSIGIGTYVGPANAATDELVHSAIVSAVKSGSVNHIDTAVNYRYQRAERCVARALRTLQAEGYNRDEFLIASKVGFAAEDADKEEDIGSIQQRYIKDLSLSSEDFVNGHSLHPAFLKDQLERSLGNLGLECVDVLYLQNPAEAQLPVLGKPKFMERLAKAFEFCQSAMVANKVKGFGIASWKCFRTPSSDISFHLSLEEVKALADKVAGVDNGFNYVQLPINLAMPEAWVCKWQALESSQEIFLNVAKKLKLNVMVSSPLLQGKTIDVNLSKTMMGVEPQGAKHLQFLRSIPSSAIKSVVVGMKKPEHVLMNTQVAYAEPLNSDNFWSYLKPEGLPDSKVAITLW